MYVADHKDSGRVLRYWTIVQPLAAAPFILVNRLTSYHWFERLPLALQWSLVILVMVGALFMVWIFLLPKWRKQWVRPSRGNWWGGLVIAYSTIIIALIVTTCFASVSGFLYLQGVATISPERSLADPLNDSFWYYLWNLLHSIPVLELPQALGWDDPPFRFTDHLSRILLLVYKIVLISPVTATIVLICRNLRRKRYKTKDRAPSVCDSDP
jgi:hypothetical protein